MRFIFEEVIYEFIVLPFGLTCSPRMFTITTRFVAGLGRSRGIRSIFYIDDILVLASSFEECQEKVMWLHDLLIHLGFIINHRKSDLLPSQKFRFLGLIWDTIQMRVLKIRERAKVVVNNPIITCYQAAALEGSIISAMHGVPYARAKGRKLQRAMSAVDLTDNHYTKKFHVSEEVREEARYWMVQSMDHCVDIKPPVPTQVITTDASLDALGVELDLSLIHI